MVFFFCLFDEPGSSTRAADRMSNWGGSLISSARADSSSGRPRNVVRIPID